MAQIDMPSLPAISLIEDLRGRLRSRSVRSVSRLSLVDRAAIARFRSGQRDLYLSTASRLCDAMGLKLVEVQNPPSPRIHASSEVNACTSPTHPLI
jgi:hypothetical protein